MQFLENYSLKHLNTFGIDVSAKYFSAFDTVAALQECLEIHSHLTSNPVTPDLQQSMLVLGGGSNVLFSGDYNGLVLKNEITGIEKVSEDADHIYLRAGAGVNWHEFVLNCIDNNYAGAENLSLIPGSVGASPMQNIGAYGVEVKDIFHELEAYSIDDKKEVTFSKSDCAFGYRESVFKNKYKGKFIITSVTYRLDKIPVFNTSYGAIEAELLKSGIHELSLRSISDAVISIRRSKLPDPSMIGNAGSFFKNPVVTNLQFEILKAAFPLIVGYPVNEKETKLAAGWLIEQCGWKGYRKGDAGCHEKQALVLVNYGNAKGEEILHLSEKIINSVKLMFDVELQKEVNIL
ncbi:MAG: UDP-N-acetylmuramate dehydrogenase [Ferruginibacter sp.]